MAAKDTTVSFEDEIPTITREGAGRRSSKYGELLDTIKEKAQGGGKPVAHMSFPKASLATSRYTSVRDAAAKREDADHWTVVTRTMGDEDFRVYIKWNEEPVVKEAKDEEPKATKTPAKKATRKATKKRTTNK